MKKHLLFFALILLIPVTSVYTQTLMEYVSEVKGDTLVIKDYYDMNNQQNSLYWAMTLDTGNVSAGRVYELKANGYYPLSKDPTTLRNTIIIGEENTSIVKSGNANSRPPLICGTDSSNGLPIWHKAAINVSHDLTVRNCNIIELPPNGMTDYSFITPISDSLTITFDNCLVEHLDKDFILIPSAITGYNITLKNCYFVNMNGWPCRRSGGVLDFFSDMDTLLVENCTHINGQGSMYRLRGNYPNDPAKFKRIIFNHNTFVNCAGYTFMNPGDQNNMSLTNNIFVNCNIQSYSDFIYTHDLGEVDPDNLPMGLVNVYPDSVDVANNTPRKFLCQDNLVYWDPSLVDIDSTLNANAIDGITNWQSQMIIMNTRTDSMFKHLDPYSSTPYSYLVTDTWKNQLPAFTDTRDLFTTQLANLKTFAISTVDTTSGYMYTLPTWRVINTGSNDFLNSDWPIPVDLSYTDVDLQTAGINGFPIGDLNWFPDKKAQWLAQRDAEYSYINAELNSGQVISAVHTENSLPVKFQLQQNYPNPFNPTTIIKYQIPVNSYITLKVYDILGNLVKTLVDNYQAQGEYSINFNAANLASGVYFYRFQAGDYSAVKKLLLLK